MAPCAGQVLAMGEGRAGQLGLGPGGPVRTDTPRLVTGPDVGDDRRRRKNKQLGVDGLLLREFVVEVACGSSHSVCRTRDVAGVNAAGEQITRNKVFGWGDNSRGQLGCGGAAPAAGGLRGGRPPAALPAVSACDRRRRDLLPL